MGDKTRCPFCAEENPAVASSCEHCGHDLHSMRLARSQAQAKNDRYEIVPEGEKFAITFRGDIKVHGLDAADLEKAKAVLAILNGMLDDVKEAG
jgi:hypothetical protein